MQEIMKLLSILTILCTCTLVSAQSYIHLDAGLAYGISSPTSGSDIEGVRNSGATTRSLSLRYGKTMPSHLYFEAGLAYSTWKSQGVIDGGGLRWPSDIDSSGVFNPPTPSGQDQVIFTDTYTSIGAIFAVGYRQPISGHLATPYFSAGLEPQVVSWNRPNGSTSPDRSDFNVAAHVQVGVRLGLTADLDLTVGLDARTQLMDGLPDNSFDIEKRHNLGARAGMLYRL